MFDDIAFAIYICDLHGDQTEDGAVLDDKQTDSDEENEWWVVVVVGCCRRVGGFGGW